MKRSSDNLPNAIDDVVSQMIYGNRREPPGDDNSPYQKLLSKKNDVDLPGVWTPPNSLCKAMGLKWLFPNISGPFKLPEEKPIHPHLVIGYDAFKYKEVMELSNQYPEAIMKYGFFSSDIPGEGQLLTKTVEKFEKRSTPPTYDEKIVLQLVKLEPWFDEFWELGPSYMSLDTVEGEKEAKIFFPATYDIPEDIILEIKKKPKKKTKSKFVAVVEAHEDEIFNPGKDDGVETVVEAEEHASEDNPDDQQNEDKATEVEDDEGEEGVEEIDKATSPMNDKEEEEND